MSIDHYRNSYIHICVVMSWDVLSVGVSTADWQLFVHINIVMSIDYKYIYVWNDSWDVLSAGVSTANWYLCVQIKRVMSIDHYIYML